MPREWLYFLGLLLPLVFSVLVLHTGFVDGLWYGGHEDLYNLLVPLRTHPEFLKYMGGWPLPVFTLTVFAYWITEYDEKDIQAQFLMLPIAYVPFVIFGTALVHLSFDSASLYVYPLAILPIGYLYVLSWALSVWLFSKFKIVV